LITSHRYSCSLILKLSRSPSWKILTTCSIAVRFPTSSLLMRRLLYATRWAQELERPNRETTETKFTLTSCRYVGKTFTSLLHSRPLVTSSETGADNSPVSSTAAQSIGTIHGQVRHSTLSLTDNIKPRRHSWASLNILMAYASLLSRFTTRWMQLRRISMPS